MEWSRMKTSGSCQSNNGARYDSFFRLQDGSYFWIYNKEEGFKLNKLGDNSSSETIGIFKTMKKAKEHAEGLHND